MKLDGLFDAESLKALSKMADGMKEAYGEGLAAMDMAGEMATEDIEPDHEIELAIRLRAQVEGRPYKVDATVIFEVELGSVLDAPESPMAQIMAALGGAGVDLGEDADAVMEQLGTPRLVGRVREIETRELEMHGPDGRIDAALNRGGTALVTMDDGELRINCEGVFSYPQHPGCYAALPAMEAMQSNVVVAMESIGEVCEFDWTEADKDNLQVSGTVVVRPLD